MPSRRKSRERALQVLFQCDLRKMDLDESLQQFYQSLYSPDDFPEQRMPRDRFMEELTRGAMERQSEIDRQISEHSEHWRLERMPVVDRNILRLATFELMQKQLAPAVVIDEALELARRYSAAESVKFVNGVLDAVKRAVHPDDAASAPTAETPRPGT
jgi:N utilization substance protein B